MGVGVFLLVRYSCRPASPGQARLGMTLEPLHTAPHPYRDTSLIQKRPTPWDPPRTLDIGLR